MEYIFTDDNFNEEVSKSELPVLIDFYAEWCGPCKMMSPIIDELAQDLDQKVKVGKLNIDENPEIAQKYEVMSVPTLIYFVNGEEKKRIVGARSKEDILKEIGISNL